MRRAPSSTTNTTTTATVVSNCKRCIATPSQAMNVNTKDMPDMRAVPCSAVRCPAERDRFALRATGSSALARPRPPRAAANPTAVHRRRDAGLSRGDAFNAMALSMASHSSSGTVIAANSLCGGSFAGRPNLDYDRPAAPTDWSEPMTPVLGEIIGWELLLVVAVIALLFGAKNLPKLARSLGSSKTEFEKGLKEGHVEPEDEKPA
jgi:sec-independent protein translocase protein TatA